MAAEVVTVAVGEVTGVDPDALPGSYPANAYLQITNQDTKTNHMEMKVSIRISNFSLQANHSYFPSAHAQSKK